MPPRWWSSNGEREHGRRLRRRQDEEPHQHRGRYLWLRLAVLRAHGRLRPGRHHHQGLRRRAVGGQPRSAHDGAPRRHDELRGPAEPRRPRLRRAVRSLARRPRREGHARDLPGGGPLHRGVRPRARALRRALPLGRRFRDQRELPQHRRRRRGLRFHA